MHSLFNEVREYLAPVLRDSKFKESGVLTPEEFIAAGDQLVFRCPTWSWYVRSRRSDALRKITHAHTYRESGDKSRRKDYLPDDKHVGDKKCLVFQGKRLDDTKSSRHARPGRLVDQEEILRTTEAMKEACNW